MGSWWRSVGTLLALHGVAPLAGVECDDEKRGLPPLPTFATEYNGKAWPAGCSDSKEVHFFVIGDWGGMELLGRVRPFRWKKRPTTNAIDTKPQHLVADRMKEQAAKIKPKFVVNVGDNFYPAGLRARCNDFFPWTSAKYSRQFRYIFELFYRCEALERKEWHGVLGNHDYGGHKYDQGWIQTIYHTWKGEDKGRWLTPAQYWSRQWQFDGFEADFFFIDTNVANAHPPSQDHSMCSKKHSGASCVRNNPDGPSSPDTCYSHFQRLWKEEKAWLEKGLAASTAQWQILVMHHPPETFLPYFKDLCERMGVDLMIAGHRHTQEVHYGPESFFGATAEIVSGGGGGIMSEGLPSLKGLDGQYGFMDVTLTKETITIKAFSHGGEEGRTIIRSTTTVKPRERGAGAALSFLYTNGSMVV